MKYKGTTSLCWPNTACATLSCLIYFISTKSSTSFLDWTCPKNLSWLAEWFDFVEQTNLYLLEFWTAHAQGIAKAIKDLKLRGSQQNRLVATFFLIKKVN